MFTAFFALSFVWPLVCAILIYLHYNVDALAAWLLCVERLADAIVDEELADLGVTQTAAKARLVKMIEGGEGVTVPQGSLDITLYRDDLQTVGPRPVVGPTYLPWDLDGKHIVIVDVIVVCARLTRAFERAAAACLTSAAPCS